MGSLWFRVRPGTSDVRTLEQVFGRHQYGIPCEPPPRTILDAGANFDAAALCFAHRRPGAQIAALEPKSSNFVLLQENIRRWLSIVAVAAALWPPDIPLRIANPTADKWGFRMTADSTTGGHVIPGISIRTLLARFGWMRIDLLKMDIEGAERELFAVATDWLDVVDVVLIETHDDIAPGALAAVQRGTRASGFTGVQSGETWWFTRPTP